MLMKETEEGINKESDTLYLWTGGFHTVKMSILPKLTYGFTAILITNPAGPFVDTDKIILKFMWKGKGTEAPETVWKRR